MFICLQTLSFNHKTPQCEKKSISTSNLDHIKRHSLLSNDFSEVLVYMRICKFSSTQYDFYCITDTHIVPPETELQ